MYGLDCAPNAGSSSGCSFYSPISSLDAYSLFIKSKKSEVLLKMPFQVRQTPAHPQLAPGFWQMELSSAGPILSWCSWPRVMLPGTAVLGWPWADEPQEPLVSCVWQLYGDFEQGSQKHLHSCDRDTQPGLSMLTGPSCSWRLAGTQQDFDDWLWLWQKTRLLILLLYWNYFEAENIFMF